MRRFCSIGILCMARERAGLVRWKWRQPLEMVKQLEVTTALVNPRQERSRNLYRIQAGDIFLAPGFPKQWCMALADDLLARWPSEGSDGSPNPRPTIAADDSGAAGAAAGGGAIDAA